jgi:hypothetical protein
MKKFGTPIGAGPGNEKLNVGFDGVGTPPPDRNAPGLDDFGVTVVAPVVVEEDVDWPLG